MNQLQERRLPRGGSFFRARFLFPWVANLCLHVAIMGYREDVAQPIAQSKGNRTRAGRAGLDGNAYFCRSINKSRNRNRSNSRSIGLGLGKNNRQSPSKQRSIMKKNKMKKILTAAFCAAMASPALAQGWPTGYEGVILQGFYWDSYSDSQWKNLEKQAPELGSYFSLLWVPQSGKCLEEHNVMGTHPITTSIRTPVLVARRNSGR